MDFHAGNFTAENLGENVVGVVGHFPSFNSSWPGQAGP
jgi:hypothetical protein